MPWSFACAVPSGALDKPLTLVDAHDFNPFAFGVELNNPSPTLITTMLTYAIHFIYIYIYISADPNGVIRRVRCIFSLFPLLLSSPGGFETVVSSPPLPLLNGLKSHPGLRLSNGSAKERQLHTFWRGTKPLRERPGLGRTFWGKTPLRERPGLGRTFWGK